jgi:phasin family protein
MAATITDLMELQKAQVNALQAFGEALFASTEKLVNLNVTAAKAALQDAAATGHTLAGARDVQELAALVGGAAQPTLEKLVGYSRNAYGIASGLGVELSKIVEDQVADANRKFAELIELAAKGAPTGTEPAVSLFKNAVAAANTAFDTAAKATRQATDWAESNFASATSATLNAAAAANDSAKPKSRKAA